jgi:uncharacterized protein YndB with AHSA1/START domain
MSKNIEKTYKINASVDKVWEALTTPEIIKEYFFGTNAISDWKQGSSIIYRGEWKGKAYEDKGIILKLIPEKLLTINYFSGMTGKPDKPENYSIHSYKLEPDGANTRLTIEQEDDYQTDESRSKAWDNWDFAINELNEVMKKHKALSYS